MAILTPLISLVVAGKIVAINYEVYRRLKARSHDKVKTLELIEAEIAELEKALEGPAGPYAKAQIEGLQDARKYILESGDEESYTVTDYVEDMSLGVGETIGDIRTVMTRASNALYKGISQAGEAFDQMLSGVQPDDDETAQKKNKEKNTEDA